MNYTPQVWDMKKLLSATYNKCQEKSQEITKKLKAL